MTEKKKIKFQFNDNLYDAFEGDTLLDIMLENSVLIPHYCYHPALPADNVCRMCVVEKSGEDDLVPSCKTKIADGMIVRNDTERVKNAVNWNLQYHLNDHPLDCPVCEKSGACELQEFSIKTSGDTGRLSQSINLAPSIIQISEKLSLDNNRCIMCTRCVRFCDHITKSSALGIKHESGKSTIFPVEQIENNYSMNLVDICPVGAIKNNSLKLKQQLWNIKELHTTCIGCETGCSISINQDEKGAYWIKPRYDEKVNGHWMCDEGRELVKNLSGTKRLHSPMVNQADFFFPTDMENVVELLKGKNFKFILNASLTSEEVISFFENIGELEKKKIALYVQPDRRVPEDSLLKRSGSNANLRGIEEIFRTYGIDSSKDGLDKLIFSLDREKDAVFVVIPEFIADSDHFKTFLAKVRKACLCLGLSPTEEFHGVTNMDILLPVPSFAEKDGHIVNYAEMERQLNKGHEYVNVDDLASHLTWILNDTK